MRHSPTLLFIIRYFRFTCSYFIFFNLSLLTLRQYLYKLYFCITHQIYNIQSIAITNSLFTVIKNLISFNMISRSHLMARSKQQLKRQLLTSFRKKNKQEIIDIQKSQSIEIPSPQNNQLKYESSVSNYQSKNFYTPSNCCERQRGYSTQNRNILDQFSKCPITDEQTLLNAQKFLDKFMFTKSRPAFPSSAKTLIQVQVQTQNLKRSDEFMTKNTPLTKIQQRQITPHKIEAFNEKQEKSLIDVSANLSNYKFPITQAKQNLIMLTDSILQNQMKQESNHSSTEQLLRQLGQSKPKRQQSEITTPKEQISIKKVPIVKVIQLNRPKSNPQHMAQFGSHIGQSKQNKTNNLNQIEQNQQSQRLQKLLSKKSLLKNLIIKKNGQDAKKLQNEPNIEERDGKWNKPMKNYANQPKMLLENKKIMSSGKLNNVQRDPLDDLPAYQSSNSQLGLEAVIEEEQNESQLGDSVKHTHHKEKQCNEPRINRNVQYQPKINKQNGHKHGPSQNNFQKKTINQDSHLQLKDSEQELKQISLQDLQDQSAQLNSHTLQKQKFKTNQNAQVEKKQYSLSDLPDISLEDISQIQNKSDNKRADSSLKKIKQIRELSENMLPDYIDSDNESQHSKEKVEMQKYIVNNISQDINQLKDKIIRDSGIELKKQTKDVFAPKKQTTSQQRKQAKSQSRKGSEGPDKKVVSMLDFFDQVHEKIDFGQISKSIKDLKQKILDESQ